MPHHVYTTRAFVLKSSPVGEANKLFNLYTEDLGLIRATAQGVRKAKSKLRHNLQDLGFAVVSLVRGREFWKIVGAEELSPSSHGMAPAARFLLKFIHGEGKSSTIFLDLVSLREILSSAAIEKKKIELVFYFRSLRDLGYIHAPVSLEYLIQDRLTPDLVRSPRDLEEAAKLADQAAIESGFL